MKDFEKIDKDLPYNESQQYIASIIDKGIERAISSKHKQKMAPKFRRIGIIASGIAAVIAVFIFIQKENSQYSKIANSEPLTTVLTQMSDQEILNLPTYSLDEIPEY